MRTQAGNLPPPLRQLKLAAGAVLVALVVWCYVGREDNAYYWDFVGYWQLAGISLQELRTVPGIWLADVLHSIWEGAYNFAFTLPLLPVMAVFGSGRLPFIEGLALLFMVPAMVLARSTLRDPAPAAQDRTGRLPCLSTLWIGCYLPFWIPTLRGLPDVVGLLPLIAATQMLVKGRLLRRERPGSLALLAVLLYLPILLREWYGFAVVALFCCGFPYSLWLLRGDAAGELVTPAQLVRKWIALGALLLLCGALLQGGMLHSMITSPPSQLYAGYQLPVREELRQAYDFLGLPVLCSALLGCLAALRQPRIRGPVTVFYLACVLLTLLLFTRVQGLDIQHYLPVAWFLLPLSLGGLGWLYEGLGAGHSRRLLVPAVGLVVVAGFLANLGFLPGGGIGLLAPADRYPPLRYPVGNDYAGLLRELGELTAGNDRTIAIFASSPRLSYSLIGQIAPLTLAPHLVPTAEIDSRDQMYAPALLSDCVVVADPVQVHRPPAAQQVIVIPNRQILGGTGIGAAYQLLGRHALGDGAYALVYRKTRPFRPEEIDSLFLALIARYPAWRPAYDTRMRDFLASGSRLAATPGSTRPGTAHLVMAP